MTFNKNRNSFNKGSYFHKVRLFWGNDCLSLKLKDNKTSAEKLFLKTLYNLVCIFNLGCVTSQSLQYGGIHDDHFEYIQTTITSLFLGRF